MKAKRPSAITLDSIWLEANKRMTRYVKVVGFVDAGGRPRRSEECPDVTLRVGKIAIARFDHAGHPTGRVTYAAAERFGRAGGYKATGSNE